MDLSKLKPIDFRRRLNDLESQAIIVRKARNNGLVRVTTGLVAGLGTMFFAMWPLMIALEALAAWFGIWLALPMFFLGLGGIFFLTMKAGGRYLSPPERRLLPMLLEPDASDFLEDNWTRRDGLLEEAEAFNETLEAFKALPERSGGDEIDAGVLANLAERRARFEAKAETYFADFRGATEQERARVAKANTPRKRLGSGSPHRQSLREFKRKVRKLADLERSLEGLMDSVDSGTTVDLSPHLAAQRFRAELEEERAILIRCGLTPKKLPKPRTGRKFLPSGG